jgi:hypothetical protein
MNSFWEFLKGAIFDKKFQNSTINFIINIKLFRIRRVSRIKYRRRDKNRVGIVRDSVNFFISLNMVFCNWEFGRRSFGGFFKTFF